MLIPLALLYKDILARNALLEASLALIEDEVQATRNVEALLFGGIALAVALLFTQFGLAYAYYKKSHPWARLS